MMQKKRDGGRKNVKERKKRGWYRLGGCGVSDGSGKGGYIYITSRDGCTRESERTKN